MSYATSWPRLRPLMQHKSSREGGGCWVQWAVGTRIFWQIWENLKNLSEYFFLPAPRALGQVCGTTPRRVESRFNAVNLWKKRLASPLVLFKDS